MNTTRNTKEQIEAELAHVLELQTAWKHRGMAAFACEVVKAALETNGVGIWPDAEPIVAAVAKLDGDDKNLVGTAWRLLKNIEVMERLPERRRSTAGPSKGREIARWRVCDRALAKAFLQRNGAAAVAEPQQELFPCQLK